jgi:hypothetical protein
MREEVCCTQIFIVLRTVDVVLHAGKVRYYTMNTIALQQTAASDLLFTLFNDDVTFDESIWRRMGWECESTLILTQFKI